MPELRRDDLSGRWVLLAPGRVARPHTFAPPPRGDTVPSACPFCPGNERMTPPEVHRTGKGEPDTPGWRVRVAPNLYPIVGGPDARSGATGAHEVVVLSPSHTDSFAQLDKRHAAEVLAVLRDRSRHHLAAGHAFVQVAINHGHAAGASIAHPHAQLVALDFVPPAVVAAVERFQTAGRDLVVADLEAAGSELRVLDGRAPAWCPQAGSTPYELRVAPRAAGTRCADAADGDMEAVAESVRNALAMLAASIGDVPYNLVVHTAAPATDEGGFHWYIEVQTRTLVVAGFEQGTGVFVNTMPPESAAPQLRASVEAAEQD